MAYQPLPQLGNESPGYYVPAEDASTQTTEEDFILLEPVRDASTQTTEKDFILLEPVRDASTQTTENDFDFLKFSNPINQSSLSQIQSTRNVPIVTTQATIDTSEMVQFENSKDFQSVVARDEKAFLCKACDKALEGHVEMNGRRIFYVCCVCNYKTGGKAILQQHVDIHCARNICTICTREYSEGDPHYTENTSCLCKKEFRCKTFLDLHYVYHETYFTSHCWVCKLKINEHLKIRDKGTFYLCCACGYKGIQFSSKMHNRTHSPQLFCIVCKEEYPIKEKNWHDKEFKCIVCQKTFQCHTTLENHFEEHIVFSSSHCIFCHGALRLHQKGLVFQCCICLRCLPDMCVFEAHLLSHTDLRLYKCDDCGKRLSHIASVKYHSAICIPLHIKCEICLARFPNNDSLEHHSSIKHT